MLVLLDPILLSRRLVSLVEMVTIGMEELALNCAQLVKLSMLPTTNASVQQELAGLERSASTALTAECSIRTPKCASAQSEQDGTATHA